MGLIILFIKFPVSKIRVDGGDLFDTSPLLGLFKTINRLISGGGWYCRARLTPAANTGVSSLPDDAGKHALRGDHYMYNLLFYHKILLCKFRL